jgi:hypothetical protein
MAEQAGLDLFTHFGEALRSELNLTIERIRQRVDSTSELLKASRTSRSTFIGVLMNELEGGHGAPKGKNASSQPKAWLRKRPTQSYSPARLTKDYPVAAHPGNRP